MTRLTFTPGNHAYWLIDPDIGRKTRITSVTTLLNLLDKPALKRWAANTAADYAIDHWDDLTPMALSARRAAIAGAPWQSRDKKAAGGTAVHTMAEALLDGQPVEVSDDLRGYVEGLARWLERSGVQLEMSEALVWSDEDDDLGLCAYGGRFDAIVKHPRHGRLLVDWKTASGVWPENAVQLAGYAGADHIVIGGEDRPMLRVDALAVAHIRPDGTDLHIVPADSRRIAAQRFDLLRSLKTLPEPTLEIEATA